MDESRNSKLNCTISALVLVYPQTHTYTHIPVLLSQSRLFSLPLVQVFKSDIGPDGNSRDELDVACTVDHPNLTKALCIVRAKSSRKSGPISTPPLAQANADAEQPSADDTTGTAEAVPEDVVGDRGGIADKQWLVMERVAGEPLAEKPDFSSVLRCRWGSGRRFEPVLVLAVLLQVCHGLIWLEDGVVHFSM